MASVSVSGALSLRHGSVEGRTLEILMKQLMTQGMRTDRLGLTDLLEVSDLLLRSEVFRFTVTSWSMYPALKKGDRIIVDPVPPAQLQAGDLILFHDGGQLVCHRLVETCDETGTGSRIITKGDAVAQVEVPLQADQILGKVVAVKRRGIWLGPLAIWIDRGKERLAHVFVQVLKWLQELSIYRRSMRGIFSRCFSYFIGLPEGTRWYRYQGISFGGSVSMPHDDQRYHLVAKLAGIYVGSVYLEAKGGGYWLQDLCIRTRYRGLGVASQLLAFACKIAALSHRRVLFARVGQEDTAAQRLFEKQEFQPVPMTTDSGFSVLARNLHS